jgi:hypothetical protein
MSPLIRKRDCKSIIYLSSSRNQRKANFFPKPAAGREEGKSQQREAKSRIGKPSV